MVPGQRIELGPGELVTCVRSAAEGGVFEFELDLADGVDGPPTHHHPADETIDVRAGRIEVVVAGRRHVLGPGDRLEIPAGVPHTFRVPRGAGPLRARCRNGGRFERLVDQHADAPRFTRMALYATRVDREASYMVSPLVRGLLAVVALVGRLRGVRTY